MKKVLRGPDTMFYNSQAIIVEYEDVINLPGFNVLNMIINSSKLSDLLGIDVSRFLFMDADDVLEWYLSRKTINPLESLAPKDEIITKEVLDNTYRVLLNTQDAQSATGKPNIIRVLNEVIHSGLVKNLYVYINNYNDFAKERVRSILPEAMILEDKSFTDTITNMPTDVTYVLSDIDKIVALNEIDKLSCSAILVPYGLRYNHSELGKEKPEIDELSKDVIFKLAYFNNFFKEIKPEIDTTISSSK